MTQIYQVIEYQPKTFFKQFGDTVMDVRRDSDRDESCAVKSDTMKLLGFSLKVSLFRDIPCTFYLPIII